MVLLAGMLEAGPDGGTALARVDPGAWYADPEGAMPAWFGLELMAQAIAACRSQYLAGSGRPPRGGYLVSARGYRSAVPAFAPGAELAVRVRLELEDPSGLCGFHCEIRQGEAELASASLKVMERP
jgi:predicted hotdog family 3-hydroxylacyl-ACP dehydratase